MARKTALLPAFTRRAGFVDRATVLALVRARGAAASLRVDPPAPANYHFPASVMHRFGEDGRIGVVGAADGPVTEGPAARRGGGSYARLRTPAASPSSGRPGDAPPRLSRREAEVLVALGERLTNAEI